MRNFAEPGIHLWGPPFSTADDPQHHLEELKVLYDHITQDATNGSFLFGGNSSEALRTSGVVGHIKDNPHYASERLQNVYADGGLEGTD